MKQTSVQWLIEQYNFGIVLLLQDEITVAEFSQEISRKQKIALEMEKEQIMRAYDIGSNEGYDLAKIDDIEEGHYMKEPIEYYKETYEAQEN